MIVKAEELSGASTELELSPANLGAIIYALCTGAIRPLGEGRSQVAASWCTYLEALLQFTDSPGSYRIDSQSQTAQPGRKRLTLSISKRDGRGPQALVLPSDARSRE